MILPIHAALKDRLHTVLTELYGLDTDAVPEIAVQYPPDRSLGDLGIPVAFELARTLRRAPRTIAAEVVAALGRIDGIARAEAAPNGYVNVFLDRAMFVRKTCTTPAAAATAPATKLHSMCRNAEKVPWLLHQNAVSAITMMIKIDRIMLRPPGRRASPFAPEQKLG